jgi:trans-2,3-dihydro-3-hydroxyanthranilate isomerase
VAYEFVTLDVFTDRTFGGNPLAVLPDARGLNEAQMQAIAREFNYSETTFVLPPENADNTRRVRIFTTMSEIPFAGHPNVGTAVALVRLGLLGDVVPGQRILFEEPAGVVSVILHGSNGEVETAEFIAPVINRLGDEVPAAEVTRALGLGAETIATDNHAPRVVDVGLRFLYVELKDLEALRISEAAPMAVTQLSATRGLDGVFAYVRSNGAADGEGGVDMRARLYAPAHGVTEDPATGSANAGLANLLASLSDGADETLSWSVGQGVEMGRPGRLRLTVERRGGQVAEVRVAGAAVVVCRGTLELDGAEKQR